MNQTTTHERPACDAVAVYVSEDGQTVQYPFSSACDAPPQHLERHGRTYELKAAHRVVDDDAANIAAWRERAADRLRAYADRKGAA